MIGNARKEMRGQSFWALPALKVVEFLQTDSRNGLTEEEEEEAERRIKVFGPNIIEKPQRARGFFIFLSQFKSPLILILLFAGFITFFIAHYRDALFIFASFGSYTLFLAFSVRSLDKSIFSYPFFSNRYLVGGVGIGMILMGAAIYVPFMQSLLKTTSLPFYWFLGVVAVGILNILAVEFGKWIFQRQN